MLIHFETGIGTDDEQIIHATNFGPQTTEEDIRNVAE